jgi:hypothetical protein
VEIRAFAPAPFGEVDVLVPKYHSHYSGLHIKNAAEFVSMESLPGDTHEKIIRSVSGGVYCT